MNAIFSVWSRFYLFDNPEDAILELERDGLFNYELSGEKYAPITTIESRNSRISTANL